jgi:tetratricopeptide (TPR) repeat protein
VSGAWKGIGGEEFRWAYGIAFGLVLLVGWVFAPTGGHEFVNYDDNDYVYANPMVVKGLSGAGLQWALLNRYASNWHPLTWLSHMLDVELYGLWAGGHHQTNVVLHLWGSVLLFWVLREMTGALGRSALVAAVFAVHPLHVESVAWVAERKDVLSGVFFMLTLGAYVRYVRKPTWSRYGLVVLLFGLGLMSKPSLVTLPCVLLLLDYWPLQRWTGPRFPWPLLKEKIPLLGLAALSCFVTLWAQQKAVLAIEVLPFSWRLENALVSYGFYLGQMFWPVNLTVFYPYPSDGWEMWQVFLAIVGLGAISAVVWWRRKAWPWLVVGWLWYVGVLVPMIGLVQVGGQTRADRYTYLSQIGLFLILAWGGASLVCSRKGRMGVGALSGILLAAWAGAARSQVRVWRDSETLWSHAVQVTERNAMAYYNLGVALSTKGNLEASRVCYEKALEISSSYVQAHINYGVTCFLNGQPQDAIFHLRKALQIEPTSTEAWANLGFALSQTGQEDEGMACYRKVLELDPSHVQTRLNLGNFYMHRGEFKKGVEEYQRAVEWAPQNVSASNTLAWVLATHPEAQVRQPEKALQWARRADVLAGGQDPSVLDTLAAAQAGQGQFLDAIQTAERALVLAEQQHAMPLVVALRQRIGFYRAGQPFRDETLGRPPNKSSLNASPTQ